MVWKLICGTDDRRPDDEKFAVHRIRIRSPVQHQPLGQVFRIYIWPWKVVRVILGEFLV